MAEYKTTGFTGIHVPFTGTDITMYNTRFNEGVVYGLCDVIDHLLYIKAEFLDEGCKKIKVTKKCTIYGKEYDVGEHILS